jgi:hypothetical protein
MPAYVKLVTRSAVACLIGSLMVAAAACQTRPSPSAAKKADAAPVAPGPAAPSPQALPESLPPPGPYHVLAPLRDTAAFDACSGDADCAVAALRCCDCTNGGLGVAVARDKLPEWTKASCVDPASPCGGTPSGDPTCRGAARCLNGHCRLTVQATDLTAPGEPAAPPAPAARPASTGTSKGTP